MTVECEHCQNNGPLSTVINSLSRVEDYDCICEDCIEAIEKHQQIINDAIEVANCAQEDAAKGRREEVIAFGMRRQSKELGERK